jgi:organic radical activating enzyme
MLEKKIYCTAPWNGLTIREDGQVKTCCVGLRGLGNLNFMSMQDIENGQELRNIQQGMLNGEPDYENCKVCIELEKTSGHATLRNHYNNWYPSINDNQLRLKFIDVRWNNVCNLSCMYCTPMFSSTWADKLAVKIKNQPVKQYQEELLSWILERADHVSEIMLVGGEPMLMKQNYELLKRLPADCQISIITNLSYDLENNPALPFLLNRPPEKINWNVSLENIDKKFEYVRSGASWDQIKKNLEFLVAHWPNTVSLNMVYSLFCAFDIVESTKQFHQLGIKKFNLFNINDNDTMNVFNMPDIIKQKAFQQLQSALDIHLSLLHPDDRQLYPWQGIESMMSSLNKPGSTKIDFDQFQQKIAWYDQWNQHKFSDLWPDVFDLVQSSLN